MTNELHLQESPSADYLKHEVHRALYVACHDLGINFKIANGSLASITREIRKFIAI